MRDFSIDRKDSEASTRAAIGYLAHARVSKLLQRNSLRFRHIVFCNSLLVCSRFVIAHDRSLLLLLFANLGKRRSSDRSPCCDDSK